MRGMIGAVGAVHFEADDLPAVEVEDQIQSKRVRSATLLGAGGLVPDVVGDGRGRHGEARFAGGGRSYD
jgi:hypothetical protein